MATAPITRLAVVFLVPPMVGGPISLNGSVGQFVIGIIMLDAIPGIVVIAGPLLFVRKSPFDLDRWAFWATMALGPPLVLLGISFTRGNDFGSWLFVMVSPIMGFVVIAPWIVMVRRTMRDSVLSVAPPAADDEVDFWVSLRSA